VRQGDTNRDDVWFYTHWCGTEIKETVAKALGKRLRWTDPSYLARIMFDVLTDGQTGSETGFGISSQIGDNEYPIVVVDCPNQKVWVIEEDQLMDDRLPNAFKPAKVFTFGEWITKHLPK